MTQKLRVRSVNWLRAVTHEDIFRKVAKSWQILTLKKHSGTKRLTIIKRILSSNEKDVYLINISLTINLEIITENKELKI